MNGGAWWAKVHGVAKSQTLLSNFTLELVVKKLPAKGRLDVRHVGSVPGSGRSPGEGNAVYCSNLAWRIPWTEEPVHSLFRGYSS